VRRAFMERAIVDLLRNRLFSPSLVRDVLQRTVAHPARPTVEAGVGLSCAREAKLPQMKRRRGDLLVHWYCTGVEQGHWMGTSATVRIL